MVILRHLTGSRRNQTLMGIWNHTHYAITRAAWLNSGIEPLTDVLALPTGRLQVRWWTIEPDLTIRDFANHYYDTHTGEGGAIKRIVELFEQARNTRDIRTIAHLSHYIADLAQPLHTRSSPEEKTMHATYETDIRRVASREPKMFLFDKCAGYTVTNVEDFMMHQALVSNSHYYSIVGAYINGNGLYDCYNTTRLCFTRACAMVEAVTREVFRP